jgi:hypothetical protein
MAHKIEAGGKRNGEKLVGGRRSDKSGGEM